MMLETKLYAPRWPAGLVARTRLVDRVQEGSTRRLTVISAPAGSGKTTLLAEWLARDHADAAVAWVSLDSEDNNPASFWMYVIRALQRVLPGIGEAALMALQGEPTPSVASLTALINEIAGVNIDTTLILDDYHVIDSSEVHTAFAFFVDHLPPTAHLVIATRADPLLPLSRMRARGEMIELRSEDLRFTPEEAGIFLLQAMRLDLSPQHVTALEKRTEGWIAGLKLAALSIGPRADADEFIRVFSGNNRYVADYLVEEVLQLQPEHTRRFLLATAMLDRLSGPLCDAVMAGSASASMLEDLEKRNLFVVALDDQREWYRYHHLFAEVLLAQAMRENAIEVREHHALASEWYERNGSISSAIRHAVKAEKLERVASLLERHWPAMDRSYHAGRWVALAKTLPIEIVRARPVLHMGYAWALLNAGELEAAHERLHDVERSLERYAAGGSGVGEPVIDDHVRYASLPRELATAQLYLAQSRGDAAGTIAHGERLIPMVAAGDHPSMSTARALLALAYWADGQLDPAHDTFALALTSMRLGNDIPSAIRGMFVLGDIRATQGRLRDAEVAYRKGLQEAAAPATAGVPETDELYLGLVELQCEYGNTSDAEELLESLDQLWSSAVHAGNRHRRSVVLARLAEARRDFDVAYSLLEDAEQQHRRDPLPRVRPIAAMKARIAIKQGRLADAEQWAGDAAVDGNDSSFLREYENITLARLYIAQHRAGVGADAVQNAIALLERLAEGARRGARIGSVIETLVLLALAHDENGSPRDAAKALENALELGEPQGYFSVFVDEGDPMRELLRRAALKGNAHALALRIIAAVAVFAVADEPVSVSRVRAVDILTKRELEILRLIAAGMRNEEIADTLFISMSTAKRHIANIYAKLDAHHRTEALNRAAALNLL